MIGSLAGDGNGNAGEVDGECDVDNDDNVDADCAGDDDGTDGYDDDSWQYCGSDEDRGSISS